MTRREVPRGTEEESQREIEAMFRKLGGRVKAVAFRCGYVQVSIASGPASQEAGGVCGSPLAEKTASLTDQQELLRTLSGASALEQTYRDEPNRPLEKITVKPVVPQGVKPEPPTLEWFKPVQHPNGEATQDSSGGSYAVFGRRSPRGFTFIARYGLDVLGSFSSAQEARDCCGAHYTRACG